MDKAVIWLYFVALLVASIWYCVAQDASEARCYRGTQAEACP